MKRMWRAFGCEALAYDLAYHYLGELTSRPSCQDVFIVVFTNVPIMYLHGIQVTNTVHNLNVYVSIHSHMIRSSVDDTL